MRSDPRGWTYLVVLALGAGMALFGLGLAHAYDQATKITPDVLACARYNATAPGFDVPFCDVLPR